MSVLRGRVFDASGALLANASVSVRDGSTNFAVSVRTDPEGHYSIVAIPAGTYVVEVAAPGFRPEVIEGVTIEIGRTLLRNFHLAVDGRRESVVVRAELRLLDRGTGTVGHMVSARTIPEIPSRLPPGSDIQLRISTVWERYQRYILGAAGLVLAQTALIAALLVQSARRRRAEARVRANETALRASCHRLRDLGARLMGAQEAERSRISRELHDDVGQQTAMLEIDLELLGADAANGSVDLRVAVDKTLERARSIARAVRDLSHRLHPPALRLIGPAAALATLQREFARSNVMVTLGHQGVPGELPHDVTVCVFRVAQEALRNAVTHGAARTVSITLTGGETGLTLVIADDGVGFDVNSLNEYGLGLTSMRERLEPLGGTLKIRSRPGAGTRLEVRVPVPGPADAERW